jgi:DNA sulfur modification protein DndB
MDAESHWDRPPSAPIRLRALCGRSADRDVLLGFAPANTLHRISFADVLDEHTGKGYQRRFSDQHSLDFRRYIQRLGSTTIPLTFNLRPSTKDKSWQLAKGADGTAELVIQGGDCRVLAQVDCQHRLGHLADVGVELPYMILVGLSDREEMEVFNTINSKAKGLSSSLLDYHQARLAQDVAAERPELFVALQLNEVETSPWYRQLDLGGNATSGLKRRASLRTMQKAVRRFLSATDILSGLSAEECARVVHDYWVAVSMVLREQWADPRRHFLTKGVGVYALMGILADLWLELPRHKPLPGTAYFSAQLIDFAVAFDWSNEGPLKGLGGESGATAAHGLLRTVRRNETVGALSHANGQ